MKIEINKTYSKLPNWNNDIYSYKIEKQSEGYAVLEFRNNEFYNQYNEKSFKGAKHSILAHLSIGDTRILNVSGDYYRLRETGELLREI